MPLNKIINIVGISIEIIGVIVISRLDLVNRRKEAAFDRIPNNIFADCFDAEANDKEYKETQQEIEFSRLDRSTDANRSLKLFRLALLLIGAGMFCQLVAACSDL
jgi:hypothetical protein